MAERDDGSLYTVHPAVSYARAALLDLPGTTGRSLDEWLELLASAGPAGERERREWLKREHGVEGPIASMIAERSVGKGYEETDPAAYIEAAIGYVAAMYAGEKAALRPVHDAVVAMARSIGPDVTISPRRTVVPIYRHLVFAEIRPVHDDMRIDLGLSLRNAPHTHSGRLIPTGGIARGERATHRIPLRTVADVDDQVQTWMAIAYRVDGGV